MRDCDFKVKRGQLVGRTKKDRLALRWEGKDRFGVFKKMEADRAAAGEKLPG